MSDPKGIPWHCGYPMKMRGGYQCGGDGEWIGFRCDECGHQQTMWGHMFFDPDGTPVKFVPRPDKILTVLMVNVPASAESAGGVLCRGIAEDKDIFVNLLYTTLDRAVQELGKHYGIRGFRCVFNLPKKENHHDEQA